MKAMQMPIDRWMNMEDVVYLHNEILMSHKKEGNLVICDNLGGPRGYHAMQKSQRKANIWFHLYVESKETKPTR